MNVKYKGKTFLLDSLLALAQKTTLKTAVAFFKKKVVCENTLNADRGYSFSQ